MQRTQLKKWKVNENSAVKEVEEVFVKKALVIRNSCTNNYLHKSRKEEMSFEEP